MTTLNLLVLHRDQVQVRAALRRVNLSALGMRIAAIVTNGDTALTLMRQQKYHLVLADMDATAQNTSFLELAARLHPESLFLVIASNTPKRLLELLRIENVYDYTDYALTPEHLSRTLQRAKQYYHKVTLAAAAAKLMDLMSMDVPDGLKKNVRTALREILHDVSESDLNTLAQNVSILFQETLDPCVSSDFDFSKATAIELISQLRYFLFTQGLNADGEFAPLEFICRIQFSYTNEDLEDLCLYYVRRAKEISNPNSSSGQMSALVRSAIKITRKRYSSSSFTLVSLSDEIGISPNYLSSVFKMETGVRFKKYLNSYRIEQAKLLLADSHYKIYEVANLVGIEDSRYFSQIFRTYTGLKPSEYRNLCTGDEGPVID